MPACLYIVTNKPNGLLYVGVTTNLPQRAWQHRAGEVDSFTKKYNLKHLVHVEPFEEVRNAIQREKTRKHWSRAWKVALIERENPEWEDLFDRLM
ncbi:MAG: GIY-YIG nuclease family protein [Marivibrio sp.]|uniref:GIY-YIG nuclease family protein n=1 Tax=Marivibrio sp. TaxID=2039719 RepID=UPI0032EE6E2C